MQLLRFSHSKESLEFQGKKYKATCAVRNELNGWRKKHQIVKSMPLDGEAKPYYPRPFPTGVWEIGTPVYTKNPEFAPVKIPTSAERQVLIWEVEKGEYKMLSGEIQADGYYYLHYSAVSNTTLGCIRLNSEKDALEIAKRIINALAVSPVFIEVVL